MNFDRITYAKGASVLMQLVAFVGPGSLPGRRPATTSARHAYGNTTLADLLRSLERTSGRDLSAGRGSGWRPPASTRCDSTCAVDADGRGHCAAVVQTAPEGRRCVSTGSRSASTPAGRQRWSESSRIERDVDGARTPMPELVGLTRPDRVVVNDEDLTYAKVRTDPRSHGGLAHRLPPSPAR